MQNMIEDYDADDRDDDGSDSGDDHDEITQLPSDPAPIAFALYSKYVPVEINQFNAL